MLSLADLLAVRGGSRPTVVGTNSTFEVADLVALPNTGSGKPAAICISDPVLLIQTLIQLDGCVERMLLLSAALPVQQAMDILAAEQIAVVITDRADLVDMVATVDPDNAASHFRSTSRKTEWVLTTSGTTGMPKCIRHTLASLCRTVATKALPQEPHWGLLYDSTRFAGLQVVLQALIGGGVLIAPDIDAPITEQIAFLSVHGCTHLSATPSLWRRIMMAPDHKELKLRQVTLGGEIVDQPILDRLRATYPKSRITHIYASTEAGVGFSVIDGKEGFPSDFLNGGLQGTAMCLKDGVLWLKPDMPASAAPSTPQPAVEMDAEGFICSGDVVELHGNRARFLGRNSGVINVGGAKVHPETVERALLDVPGIEQVQIVAKSNPISGALVTAQVVISEGSNPASLKAAALEHCKAHLPREAVPAMLKVVTEFNVNAAGKLIRQ